MMLTSKDYCIFFSMEEDANILYGYYLLTGPSTTSIR